MQIYYEREISIEDLHQILLQRGDASYLHSQGFRVLEFWKVDRSAFRCATHGGVRRRGLVNSGVHDPLFVGLAGGKLLDDAALAGNQDAIGQAEYFRQI